MPKPGSKHRYVAGKGSWRRPAQVSEKEVSDAWDRIFGKRPLPNKEPKK